MKGFTSEWLDFKTASPKSARTRTHTGIQKQEKVLARKNDDSAQRAKVDGGMRQFFRITVNLRVSDNRDRDGDGIYSTLLDSYLFAIGRLLNLDRNALRKLAKSEEGRRRSRNNH